MVVLLRRKDQKVEILSGVPLFEGLSKRELGEVARYITELDIPAGDVLTSEGDTGREAMVILEGKATVRRKGRKVAEVGKGDVVGEMSLVTHVPRNATVIADTDMVVAHLDGRDLSTVMDEHPKVAVKLLWTVAERLVANQRSL